MKAYMAYSTGALPREGAILVIANTAREARMLAWESGECINVEKWIDLTVRLIRNNADIMLLADQAKLQQEQPHVVASPLSCEECGIWGAGLADDNRCGNCEEWPGDRIVDCLTVKQVKTEDIT